MAGSLSLRQSYRFVATASSLDLPHEAWWHPGIVLAILSAVTLVAAVVAVRHRHAQSEADRH